jgi:SNF2 family DNA or RNA helicase
MTGSARCASAPARIARRPLLKAASRLFDAARAGAAARDRFGELDAFARGRAAGHELRACDDALEFSAQLRDAEQRRQVLDQAYPKGAADPALAEAAEGPLYPYQAEGALFAARAGRALIGDEMGLGKTVQAIAAAELMARHFGVQRVLVVCPTSLKHQWQSEISAFHRAHGHPQVVAGPAGGSARSSSPRTSFCKITNYETLVRDADLIEPGRPSW